MAIRVGSRLRLVAAGLLVAALPLLPILSLRTSAATTVPDSPLHGITISPTQKEIVLGAGLIEANTAITIKNDSGKDLNGTIRLLDLKDLKSTGGLSFAQGGVSSSKYGLAKWMSLPDGNTVSVQDGQSVSVPVHIANKADLAPGGHYGAAVVTFGTEGATEDAIGKDVFKQEMVSLLFINKAGGDFYDLHLDSFTSDSANNVLPTNANLIFKNSGNVHLVPRGYITAVDEKGSILAKGIINPDSLLLLPGTSRDYLTPLTPVKSGRPRSYTLTAYYRYDGQNLYSEKTLYVQKAKTSPYVIAGLVILATPVLAVLFRVVPWLFDRLVALRNRRRRNTL